MLQDDSDRVFIVYPSWAEMSYSWSDIANGCLPKYDKDTQGQLVEEFLPSNVDPRVKLWSGAAGNGIIEIWNRDEVARDYVMALSRQANTCQPAVMNRLSRLPFRVSYLEPFQIPLSGRRSKVYTLPVTAEHLADADDSIYWLIGFKQQRVAPKLGDVTRLGQAFEMEVIEEGECPDRLRNATQCWFHNPDYEYRWFSVRSAAQGAGFHYAAILYVGLHLRGTLGPRMQFAHLVAQIPGQPSIRPHMKHW